jgi:hypothetical protein
MCDLRVYDKAEGTRQTSSAALRLHSPFSLGRSISANVSDVHEAPEPGNARRRGFHAH